MKRCLAVSIPQKVKIRKYEVDIEKLKICLKAHKKTSCKQISEQLNVPLTKVEHWFRNDRFFAIPDEDVWIKLKDLLDIKTDEFDKSIMSFEYRYGVFEMSDRCYLSCGCCPTITANAQEIRIIT